MKHGRRSANAGLWLGISISLVVVFFLGRSLFQRIAQWTPLSAREVGSFVVGLAVMTMFAWVGWTYVREIRVRRISRG